MLSKNFIYLAAIIAFSGSLTYAYQVIKGNAKPNRVSFILWGLIPLIAFFAQLGEGVGAESAMTLVVGLGPLFIVAASLVNKESYWKITRLDIWCGLLSVFAIVLWIYTGNGNTAIALSISADLLAGIPTIRKSFLFPSTEHTSVYRNAFINAGITLLIIDTWNFANYAFAVYIFTIGITIYTFVKFEPGKAISKRKQVKHPQN